MTDVLTEELAAIRRIRMDRLKELMRDLEERSRNAREQPSTNDISVEGTSPEKPPVRQTTPR